jgi:hypothetical protein
MIRVDPATVTLPPARPLVERQLAMLTRLAEIGMEIAEEAGRQATGRGRPAEGTPMRDPGLIYARVARAVRMTIALQSRLTDDLAGLARAADMARADRRRRLDRLVERAVEAEHAEGDDTGRLRDEARERLTDAELDAELDGLTFVEAVARICEDLGLSPDRTARIVAAAGADDGPPAAPWPDGAAADPSRDPASHPPGAAGGGPAARPRAPPH